MLWELHEIEVTSRWGNHAKNVEAFVADITKKYRVSIRCCPCRCCHHHPFCRHVRAANPAARNDAFCDSMALGDINTVLSWRWHQSHPHSHPQALSELKMAPIDWLPKHGWDHSGAAAGDSARFASFIQETKDLHKFFLERLQGVDQEKVSLLWVG